MNLSDLISKKMPFCVSKVFVFYDNEDHVESFKANFKEARHISEKIIYEKKGSFDTSGYFEERFLEEKLGGTHKNLKEYWPPRCIQDATKTLDENDLISFNVIPFTFNEVEIDMYRKTQDTDMSSIPSFNRGKCTLQNFLTFFLASRNINRVNLSSSISNLSDLDIFRRKNGLSKKKVTLNERLNQSNYHPFLPLC